MRVRTVALAGLIAGCGGGVVTRVGAPPRLPADLACVVVQSALADLTMESDGASLGALSTWRDRRVCLRPGPHVLRFSAPGHYPLSIAVELKPQESAPLALDLVPRP